MLRHGDRLNSANVDELIKVLRDNGMTATASSLRLSKELVAKGLPLYAKPGTAAAIALNNLLTAQVDVETVES